MKKPLVPSDEELNKAFDGAFDKPVNFYYKPTPEEIVNIRFRAIAQKALDECYEDMLKALKPLLNTIYAQLCGIRIEKGQTSYYCALDSSIDKLKALLEEVNNGA